MILTYLMATTNNVQEDESRPTTMERQVQTLMAAMECLTKQNHDLEEQLCQGNMGHNTQEEDQEGTSADKRYQEGPEGSNAPSRLERPDVSRPSTVDMAPPHIVTEMQMMREQMDLMMNALRGRVSISTTWSTEPIHPSPNPSIPSPYRQSFICRRWRIMTETRTFGSFGIFQDPNVPLGDILVFLISLSHLYVLVYRHDLQIVMAIKIVDLSPIFPLLREM